ncbi:MAG1210 family protein [Mycoplasmopsis pulmonis]|nr:hypothetical protein [Mycoplasmopsis pulmonis]MDZ7293398.1 hypothetical protein [Mycoplasmopsis pulmonis]
MRSQEIELSDLVQKYNSVYKEKHNKNVVDLFDKLVKDSNINIEENIQENKLLLEEKEKLASYESSVKSYKFLVFFLLVIPFISLVILLVYTTVAVIAISVSIILISLGIIIFVNFKINQLKSQILNFQKAVEKKENELIKKMAPLSKLLEPKMANQLFSKTFEIVHFDDYFSNKKMSLLVNKYNFQSQNYDNNTSIQKVYSGEILGNPFFIVQELNHELGTKVYKGTKTIRYRTKDNTTHTQTLVATLKKPCPFYKSDKTLIFASEAAPNLSFSRYASNMHLKNQWQVEKIIKSSTKNLSKLEKENSGFTFLGNNDFEVLFNALNRDNEKEYRMLFTPLAQRQMQELILDNKVGYGDDFYFSKNKMINKIKASHMEDLNIDHRKDNYFHYSFEKIKSDFINKNNDYFKHLYFSFAPLLSIPLYAQFKTQDYIYENNYDANYSWYEHESLANGMEVKLLKHEHSSTQNILKTKYISSENEYIDSFEVMAYGYKTVNRVDYVSVLAANGRFYSVPVKWVEYIPVSKKSIVEILANSDDLKDSQDIKLLNWIDQIKNPIANSKDKKIHVIDGFLYRVLK